MHGKSSAALGFLLDLCIARLAQEVASLHLAPAGLLDDLHDLSPVLMPAVALRMVLKPAMDELGGALGEAVFLDQAAGRLLWVSVRRKRLSCITSRRFITGIGPTSLSAAHSSPGRARDPAATCQRANETLVRASVPRAPLSTLDRERAGAIDH